MKTVKTISLGPTAELKVYEKSDTPRNAIVIIRGRVGYVALTIPEAVALYGALRTLDNEGLLEQ